MKELKVKLNEKDFNLTIKDDGLLLPNSSDILNYVGLNQLTKKDRLVKFYNFLQRYEHLKAVRYVAYLEDISFKNARIRIKRYLLIDTGFRLSYGKIENQRQTDMLFCKSELTNLFELNDVPSSETMIEWINQEGFNIEFAKHLPIINTPEDSLMNCPF